MYNFGIYPVAKLSHATSYCSLMTNDISVVFLS